ncbi:MAG: aspartate--tRNA ligase [Oscillospiraceae bacterium]|jgi:aspartyl-tRNA synthetase|nr:aspartate--tRNA ligase [Oscillospiraceae bacterium]
MENLKNFKRTKYCGEPRLGDAGTEISVCGWVQRRRDLGQLVFIDLRDRAGILQLAFGDETPRDILEKARSVRNEYVLAARGVLRERSSKNPELPTGEVELEVTELRILSEAETPPFEILDKTNVNEELRLRYRYLDLRRPSLQRNLTMRHEISRVTREYFYENGFLEIETPMLIKSTPEGARDYIVPSRLHRGGFYALPQSPQIYKQLLMLSGFDRYVQLARCFRDEDLRADRQPEFTQIDAEMSFVEAEDVMAMVEGYIVKLFDAILGVKLETPLPRLTYADAMARYGSDKPDIRFGLELCDISGAARDSGFAVFDDAVKNGGSVRAINIKGGAEALTRREIDKLTEHAKGIGARGLAYIRWMEEAPSVSFGKLVSPEALAAIIEKTGCERGDAVLIAAGPDGVTLPVLGALRLLAAKKLGIIPDGYGFLWITEFPFFEKNADTGEWEAMHHPFTMPSDGGLDFIESDPGRVTAKAYDLVVNGTELCSGSIRISDPALQERMFRALGLSPEDIEAKFGFLTEAYKYGAPPHGGVGIGLDRIAMIMCATDSLRDVVAFPKVQNASELMSGAPGEADPKQLAELGIKV